MYETHKLNETGLEQVKTLKTKFSAATRELLELMPEGREKAIVKTKLEETVFFATKGVASKPGNFTEVIDY